MNGLSFGTRRSAFARGVFVFAALSFLAFTVSPAPAQRQSAEGQSSEKALAVYADAANFQNNGAFDLAIEQWQQFLKDFPEDPLASKAAHYLGNALMQKEKPDYAAAADAYSRALKDPQFELREEALLNRGWCLHAAGTAEQSAELHREAVAAFKTLLEKFPQSKRTAQALFYAGEAAYSAGERQQAIGYYDRLLKRKEDSAETLHCEAAYAKGVAHEELEQVDAALQTFDRFLRDCGESELVGEVQVRRGDLLAKGNRWDAASDAFREAYKAGGPLADYALYRQAYSQLQSGQTEAAADSYRLLAEEFPESEYASIARLSAGQAAYRAGDFASAESAFADVLQRGDAAAKMEATHWLAQIAMQQGETEKVIKLARAALKDETSTPYRGPVQLDLAEALALQSDTREEAIALFEEVAENATDDSVAARAMYNAAFTSLQAGDAEQAAALARSFLDRFPNNQLVADVRYIEAEAELIQGNYAAATKRFDALLRGLNESHPSRLQWQLRAARAEYLAGAYQELVARVRPLVDRASTDPQRGEALFLLGAGLLLSGSEAEAVEPLQQSLEYAPNAARGGDALLMLGEARLQTGARDQALERWRELIDKYPQSRAAEQAHFRLAKQLSLQEQFEKAISHYAAVVESGLDPELVPLAQYGIGWCRLQQEDYAEAIDSLTAAIEGPQAELVKSDALLARGMAYRRADAEAKARADLNAFLKTDPGPEKLPRGQYELALLESASDNHQRAAELLQRVSEESPEYELMDRVRYELAWALKETGDDAAAAKQFGLLAENHPQSELAGEAMFYQGQAAYDEGALEQAEASLKEAIDRLPEGDPLRERALYRLGWAQFKQGDYAAAAARFRDQLERFPKGSLQEDGLLMVAESLFKGEELEAARAAFEQALETYDAEGPADEQASDADRQIRELALLHGGQALSQMERYQEALEWFNRLRSRYPGTRYLPQVFYEIGHAHHQLGNQDQALQFYAQVAGKYRNAIAARARFMMGELYFANRDFAKAIPEFQRVMYGFGAEKAPPAIQEWQAKSGFEAGRCAELLIQSARSGRRQDAINAAKDFYQYVIDRHSSDPLADKAKQRLEVLRKLESGQ